MQLYRAVDDKDHADRLIVVEAEIDGERRVVLEIENNNWPSWAIIGLNKEQALELADVLVKRFS